MTDFDMWFSILSSSKNVDIVEWGRETEYTRGYIVFRFYDDYDNRIERELIFNEGKVEEVI